MNEAEIIQSFFRKGKEPESDCFLLDNKYLVTTDSMAENTHFRVDWSDPEDIAWKLVEVNVSDIAAGGGIPTNAFLNLGLSKKTSSKEWIKAFSVEFKKRLKHYSIELSGGDTYFSEITNLTLTIIGKTLKSTSRTGGKPGDFLYMTGSVGLSAIGYKLLKEKISPVTKILKDAVRKHLRPVSRLSLMGDILKSNKVNAAMDITDGLFQDSLRLAKASSVDLLIQIDKLPDLKRYEKLISVSDILASGEELEILFLSPEEIFHQQLTCIGQARKGKGAVSFSLDGKPFIPETKGFFHF